jgi:parallel beta-helix repeat protein
MPDAEHICEFSFKRQSPILLKSLLFLLSFVFIYSISFGQTNVNGNQSGIWTKANSPYVLTGRVTVPAGQTLTIEPGVVVESPRQNADFTVYGTLLAVGTSADSIFFRGKPNPAYGPQSTHGGTLFIESDGNSSSVLRYVSVDRMGDQSEYGIAVHFGSNSTFSNSTIRNSENEGIRIEQSVFAPTIQNNKFANNPFDIFTNPNSCANISNNPNTKVTLRNGNISTNTSWPFPGNNSYYELFGTINIDQNFTLTIRPGVTVESPRYGADLKVFGTLLAQGTAADTIRFRGRANPLFTPQSTHGGTLYFNGGGPASVLDYVSIDQMGDEAITGIAVVVGTTNCTITNTSIRNSERTGIHIENNFSPTIHHNTFYNNPTNITAYPSSCGGIRDNPGTPISIVGFTINTNANWPFPGINSFYSSTSQVIVGENSTLTVDAGVLVDFGTHGSMIVNGTLRAIGTESSPVKLTSLTTSPEGPSSGFIYLNTSSQNSLLNHVVIDRLVGNSFYGYGSLTIATSSFSISSINILNSTSYGLGYGGSGSPLITNSTFSNNKTGIYVYNGHPTFSNCNIYDNTDFGINNTSGTAADTVDARNCYWGDPTGPYHPSLNLAGTGNKVSNKVKFNPWRQQPQNNQIVDLGVRAILKPVTDCNLSAADTIRVRIRNFGNGSQSNFPVSYKINNGGAVTETVTASLPPGGSLDYTFTQRANLSVVGTYTINSYTSLPADTIAGNNAIQAVVEHLPSVAAPGNLLPSAGATNLDIPLTLSWGAVSGATSYDLYVWKSTDAIPTQPLVANLTQITYTVAGNTLEYNTQYRWKVVAKRASCAATSAILAFTTRQVPDLVVESIDVPTAASSETDIVVSWRVKNQGAGPTLNQGWTDLVYLADQPTVAASSEKYYLTSRPNFSALNAGQSYQSPNFTYRIPQGVQGRYYVIVTTNVAQSLRESSFTNNERTSSAVNIALAPPPDLQVTSLVISPLNAFSEDSLTVTYTVKNAGTGPTTATNWTDYVLINTSETLDPNAAAYLAEYRREQALALNGTYSITRRVKLPGRISGTFYVHVMTDRFGQVYEYTKEDNNSRASLALNVIQRPTPNLTVNTLVFDLPMAGTPTTSSNQGVGLNWTTVNEGAIAAPPTWQENVYISTDATLDANDRLLGSLTRTQELPSQGRIQGKLSVKIPNDLPEATYRFLVKTDANDQIYENPGEDDNVSGVSVSFQIRNPDLVVSSISGFSTVNSEQTTSVQWNVQNSGNGSIFNANWVDRVYLSTNNTFEPGIDLPLASVGSNQLLPATEGYNRRADITLPVGVSGNYFLIVVTDADNSIFERDETNNTSPFSIAITLTAWPDLQISGIVAPASDTVGTPIQVSYTTVNNGSGSMTNRQWQDNIYLSPSATVNEANLIYLGSVAQNRSLANGQSFTQTVSMGLPTNLTAGPYYVVVRTDANNAIFENTDEGNNTKVASSPTTITNLPPIDLAVTAGTVLSSTITAGSAINVQWTVKNNSTSATIVSAWRDAVYLSANPVLDANDVLLANFTINGPLAAGASYTRTQSVTLPAETGGTLYILVTTDKDNVHNDDKRGNNTLPLSGSGGPTVTIVIPPPADLVPKSLFGPARGTALQPIDVTFTIRNAGTGPTPTANWTDRLYLSTDQQEGNDTYLGAFSHSGALAAGSEYTVSGQVFLPGNLTGN